jgi:hypothetical protein
MDAMGVCQSVATVLVGAVGALWLAAGLRLRSGLARLSDLGRAAPLGDPELPSLTIVATARNEAARIEAATRSLLAQDYPGCEVLIVDDRSTDETGSILDRLAAEDSSLRVLHVAELPAGWVGKSHALAGAAKATRSDWILFTDADVEFAPDAARCATSVALRERADHLAVAPDLVLETLGEAMFVAYFVLVFDLSQQPWAAQDPRSKRSIGIGAFNLVRREAYERAGGHEAIRFQLIDDLALGRILKRSGARQRFAHHGGKIRVAWHAGTRGMIRGVEKNAFAALGFRVLLALLGVAGQLFLSLAPVAGFFVPGMIAKVACVVAWVGIAIAYHAVSRTLRIRPWQALLMSAGAALFSFAILHSMWRTLARGGVDWRGTFYPLEELRRSGRVR